MQNAITHIAKPCNEKIYDYKPKAKETQLLKQELEKLAKDKMEIPLIIGGKEIRTGNLGTCIEPHNHQNQLAIYHKAGSAEVKLAIKSALKARNEWEQMPYQMRATIFMKAAELLSQKYRYTLNAATMLCQSKNPNQAEIDSAAELIDFWRFNTYYMQEIYKQQPTYSPQGMLNFSEHRALEGFIFAVTPFNFTSIAGNLPTAPALLGNVALWKPASTSVYSNYFIMKILQEAGLPDGVVNFLPGDGGEVGNPVLDSADLAGIHFTGSTGTFGNMWKRIGENIRSYKAYPRIVGETGGKDFIFAHTSASVPALATAIVRGAYEYQGQKCSAVSRLYVPNSLWKSLKELLKEQLSTIKIGIVQDFSNFMNAVIDKKSFDKTMSYIEHAKQSNEAEIIFGGKGDDISGYFIEPTIIQTTNPSYQSMVEEIFAPVLSVFAYPDEKYEETLDICDKTSPYALTGAIFANDRKAIVAAFDRLRHAAGNFYINDKPTGAVVGQQPFGGGRGSGTNDKAGSLTNLQRWISSRTIKETFVPITDYRYPFME
jgi:1-pyrroline-5-carboxylate dehydrogenase